MKQMLAVTLMNLRSIPSRLASSLVIVVGIAGVVGVMVAVLSMAAGFKAALASTGRSDRVIVMRGGSTDELSSVLTLDQAQTVLEAPGIKKTADGKPIAAREIYLLTDVVKRGTDAEANVVLRATTTEGLAVRPELKLVEGRMFKPGLREVIVGRGAQSQFVGLELGSKVPVRDGDWDVVGVFETGGDVHESEIMVDAPTLQSVVQQQYYSSVTVQLESEAAYDAFKAALTQDPRLAVGVQKEPEYYASRSKSLETFIKTLGTVVVVIMGIGAVFGALNTMYAAVSARTVEIATLRAIGFSTAPVITSVLIEALLLSLLGGVIGCFIAYALFNGHSVSTLNFQTFSQVAFAFRVTPELLQQGLTIALLLGLVGGLFPAVRAARLPVVEALRAA